MFLPCSLDRNIDNCNLQTHQYAAYWQTFVLQIVWPWSKHVNATLSDYNVIEG